MFRMEGLDHVALLVRDVEQSVRWYERVLHLRRQHEAVWGSSPAIVAVGGTSLALFRVQSPSPHRPPGRDTLCVRHVAFRVDQENFRAAQAELRQQGIAFEFQDHQIAHSIYLHDPDGHQIELTTYDLSPAPSAAQPGAAVGVAPLGNRRGS